MVVRSRTRDVGSGVLHRTLGIGREGSLSWRDVEPKDRDTIGTTPKGMTRRDVGTVTPVARGTLGVDRKEGRVRQRMGGPTTGHTT